jgi:hypothetical protein
MGTGGHGKELSDASGLPEPDGDGLKDCSSGGRSCDPKLASLYAAISRTKEVANVLDNSHACRDLRRARNQRLPAGRVLISINTVLKQSPSASSRRALVMHKRDLRALKHSRARCSAIGHGVIPIDYAPRFCC